MKVIYTGQCSNADYHTKPPVVKLRPKYSRPETRCIWVLICPTNTKAGECGACPALGDREEIPYEEAKAWWEEQ